jgi:hypothetical protein
MARKAHRDVQYRVDRIKREPPKILEILIILF